MMGFEVRAHGDFISTQRRRRGKEEGRKGENRGAGGRSEVGGAKQACTDDEVSDDEHVISALLHLLPCCERAYFWRRRAIQGRGTPNRAACGRGERGGRSRVAYHHAGVAVQRVARSLRMDASATSRSSRSGRRGASRTSSKSRLTLCPSADPLLPGEALKRFADSASGSPRPRLFGSAQTLNVAPVQAFVLTLAPFLPSATMQKRETWPSRRTIRRITSRTRTTGTVSRSRRSRSTKAPRAWTPSSCGTRDYARSITSSRVAALCAVDWRV